MSGKAVQKADGWYKEQLVHCLLVFEEVYKSTMQSGCPSQTSAHLDRDIKRDSDQVVFMSHLRIEVLQVWRPIQFRSIVACAARN